MLSYLPSAALVAFAGFVALAATVFFLAAAGFLAVDLLVLFEAFEAFVVEVLTVEVFFSVVLSAVCPPVAEATSSDCFLLTGVLGVTLAECLCLRAAGTGIGIGLRRGFTTGISPEVAFAAASAAQRA